MIDTCSKFLIAVVWVRGLLVSCQACCKVHCWLRKEITCARVYTQISHCEACFLMCVLYSDNAQCVKRKSAHSKLHAETLAKLVLDYSNGNDISSLKLWLDFWERILQNLAKHQIQGELRITAAFLVKTLEEMLSPQRKSSGKVHSFLGSASIRL